MSRNGSKLFYPWDELKDWRERSQEAEGEMRLVRRVIADFVMANVDSTYERGWLALQAIAFKDAPDSEGSQRCQEALDSYRYESE